MLLQEHFWLAVQFGNSKLSLTKICAVTIRNLEEDSIESQKLTTWICQVFHNTYAYHHPENGNKVLNQIELKKKSKLPTQLFLRDMVLLIRLKITLPNTMTSHTGKNSQILKAVMKNLRKFEENPPSQKANNKVKVLQDPKHHVKIRRHWVPLEMKKKREIGVHLNSILWEHSKIDEVLYKSLYHKLSVRAQPKLEML